MVQGLRHCATKGGCRCTNNVDTGRRGASKKGFVRVCIGCSFGAVLIRTKPPKTRKHFMILNR